MILAAKMLILAGRGGEGEEKKELPISVPVLKETAQKTAGTPHGS